MRHVDRKIIEDCMFCCTGQKEAQIYESKCLSWLRRCQNIRAPAFKQDPDVCLRLRRADGVMA